MSEDRLQQECYLWFHNTYSQHRGLLFHAPNGGARNAREGAKFKSMGVRKGVSDFIFLWHGIAYFIELKTETGTHSKEQKEWRDTITKQGFRYYTKRTFPEFKSLIMYLMGESLWKSTNI